MITQVQLLFGVDVAGLVQGGAAAQALENLSPVEVGAELCFVADAYRTVEPVTGKVFQENLDHFRNGLETGRFDTAREAQKKLASLVGNTSPHHWFQVLERLKTQLIDDAFLCSAPQRTFEERRPLRAETLTRLLPPDRLTVEPMLDRLYDLARTDPKTKEMMDEIAEGQLPVIKKCFWKARDIARRFVMDLKELPENDFEGWKQRVARYDREVSEHIQQHELKRLSGTVTTRLYQNIISAYGGLLYQCVLAGVLTESLRRGEMTWGEALQNLPNPDSILRKSYFDNGLFDYQAYPISRELADTLFEWLVEHFAERKRTEGGWKFQKWLGWEAKPGGIFHPAALNQNDPYFKTYMELTGWSLDFETDKVTVTFESMRQSYEAQDYLVMGRIAMRRINEFRLSLTMRAMNEHLTLDTLSKMAQDFLDEESPFWNSFFSTVDYTNLSPEVVILLVEGVEKQLLSLRLLANKIGGGKNLKNRLIPAPSSRFFQNSFRDPDAQDIEEKRAILDAIFEPIYTEQGEEAKMALGHLGVQAAMGNEEAFGVLKELAQGKSIVANVANWIVANFESLKPMVAVKKRLALDNMAKGIVDKECREILDGILSGRIPVKEKLAERLQTFSDGFNSILTAFDSPKQKEPGWMDDRQVERILHAEVDAIAWVFGQIARKIRDGKTIAVTPLTQIPAIAQDGRKVASIAYATILKNAIGLLLQNMHIAMDIPQEIVLANPQAGELLKEILTELIHNAIKYTDALKTKEGNWIRVRWDEETNTLAVEDNGIGIRPENLEAIWEPGFREERTGFPSSGQGLAFVKKLAAEMGGAIRVASTVNAGTTFFITLPNEAHMHEVPHTS